MNSSSPIGRRRQEPDVAPRRPAATGWALALLSVAYTAFVHQGLATPEGGIATEWWQPSGFLRDQAWIGRTFDRPVLGIATIGAPAWALAAGVLLTTRSAVARTFALCAVMCCAIMAFYGLTDALRIWDFFHWRGSVVILATGVAIGCTLGAPLLARSWLRLGSVAKVAVYFPFFFATISIIRNATGTDEQLFFNFSPWPAIPVLGLDIVAYTLVGAMLGSALGLVVFAQQTLGTGWRLAGLVAGAITPVVWFGARFSHSEAWALAAVLAASVGALGLALVTRDPNRAAALQRRAAMLGIGAALVALPLLSGRALADGDYVVSRHVHAQKIIDALSLYYGEHAEYPDGLAELVPDYIDALPMPRIGFQLYYRLGLLESHGFDYQNLGSSYFLEFVSTEWVMCSYNPPWQDIDEDEDEADTEEDDEMDDESMGEAWTCPDKRPELW